MLKRVASKVAWVGRTASMVFGLALVLALVVGASSAALAGNLDPLKLGTAKNVATKVTTMVGKVATGSAFVVKNPSGGSALDLSVGDPLADPATKTVAPMKVDSQQVVTNLNSDQLDGKDSTELRGARAYARVVSGGTSGTFSFDPNLTSGFTGVDRAGPSGGVYCLTPASGISPQSLPAVVSVDHRSTASPQGNAVAMVGTNDLCDADKFQVVTQRQFVSNGSLLSSDANNVSFTIIVP